MRRFGCVALGLGLSLLSCRLASASVTQAAPLGFSASSANVLFRISSDFLGTSGAPPFAAASFTFEAFLPNRVEYYHPAGSPSAEAFTLSVDGDYTDDGVTTAFSDQKITFTNGPVSAVSFEADNVLTAGDRFVLSTALDGALFNAVDAGESNEIATFNPGTYAIDPSYDSFAIYNTDASFAGGPGASLTPVAVPEPGSAGLLMTGMLGLALAWKARRRA